MGLVGLVGLVGLRPADISRMSLGEELCEFMEMHFLLSFLCSQDKESSLEPPASHPGYLQAVDSSGVPLCLSCQLACSASGGDWDTRFCSHT